MKILVLNCGSSSIKYQLFDMTSQDVLAKGIIEKIGLKGSFLKHERMDGHKVRLEGEILEHQLGIEYLLGVLISKNHGCIKSLKEIDAVGHRVVHGGERFNASTLIDNEVIKGIEACIDIAPLHNPPNLKGIYAMRDLLPGVQQVAVFDTAFHQTMPEHSFMYPIPYSLYKKYAIRRYGFHGTSHRYVAKRACEILDVDYTKQKMVTCHLGNGASVTAIKNGKSIDTSMGLTPVEGLMMGTRSGDVDLGVLTYIMSREEIGVQAANTLINKHSGVLGVSGISSDMREIEEEAWVKGNKRALLSLEMYYYRVRKYIGMYAAVMNGIDILVFTGGVGENGYETRHEICKDMDYMGLKLDVARNDKVRGKEKIISTDDSKVTVMIVPTNEELVIAQDTLSIVSRIKEKAETFRSDDF